MAKSVSVALAKELCPVCLKELTGPLLINKVISESAAKKVESLNNQVIGFLNKPCEECHDQLPNGSWLIIVDKEKTENINNPYRTGEIFGITREACERIFNQYHPIGYLDWREAKLLGLKIKE